MMMMMTIMVFMIFYYATLFMYCLAGSRGFTRYLTEIVKVSEISVR